MSSTLMAVVTLFVLPWFFFVPTLPTIPSTAIPEHTFEVPTGYLCAWSTGLEFYTLSDDVYGTYTGQGMYNKYVVTIPLNGFFVDEYFKVSVSMTGYRSGDKIIIQIEGLGAQPRITVSDYFYAETLTYKVTKGNTYTVLVGFLKVANVPVSYRISMG